MKTLSLKGDTEKFYRFLMVTEDMPSEVFDLLAQAIEEAMEGKLNFHVAAEVGNAGKKKIRFWLVCGDWYVEKETGQCGQVFMHTQVVNLEIECLKDLGFWALNGPENVGHMADFFNGDLLFAKEHFKRLPEHLRQKSA